MSDTLNLLVFYLKKVNSSDHFQVAGTIYIAGVLNIQKIKKDLISKATKEKMLLPLAKAILNGSKV